VVILQVHVYRIGVCKPESDSPVSRHRHRKGAFQFSGKPVELKSREVHVLGLHRGVQSVQNPPHPVGLPGVYLAAVALGKEPIDPLVAEALNHRECVILHITDIVMPGIALSRAAIFVSGVS